MPGGHDTSYLQTLVGDALARGVATTVANQPNDPVDFLGQWLLKYVKNAEIEAEFHEQKRAALQEKKRQLEQQQAHALEQQKSDAERKGAIAALAALDAEPQALAQHAVDLIKRFTSAGGVYAASVAEPEEPDWTPPEDTEEGAAESGDEEDPLPSAPEAAVPEGGETAAGEGGAEAAPSSEFDVAAAPKIQRPINYSKKYFSYMAASADQTFMHKAELFRPPPPPEDAGDDFQPEPIAPTFRILDEKIPMIYSANISFETGARFFRNFPKIGSYQACGVQVPAGNVGGEFKAVIAADTLFPEGNGQPLSQADQDFIWEVSLALSKAFEARESKAKEAMASKSATDAIEALKKKIVEIYHPPPPEATGGAEGEADPAPVSVTPAPTPAPATEGEAAPAEAIADEAPPAEDADPITVQGFHIRRMTREHSAAAEARAVAEKSLNLADEALRVVKQGLDECSKDALAALRDMTIVPQATFHVLKAVLHLLGKEPETFKNWKRSFEHLLPQLFSELVGYDATQERDLEAWKRMRQAYKGVKDAALLASEMPATHIGVILLMFIKQVRKVARKASAHRALVATEADLLAQLEERKAALAELERIKAEAEAAAEAERIAAEEAAAAAEAARLAAEEAAAASGEPPAEGEAATEGETVGEEAAAEF